jgi:hypothetical protein
MFCSIWLMLAASVEVRRGPASSGHRQSLPVPVLFPGPHESQGASRLYRQFFTPAECRMLDSSPPENALSEICLLRMLLAQALAAAKARRRLSLKERLSMLTVFSRTTLIMALLVRFQDKYFGFGSPGDNPLDALDDLDPYDLRAYEVPP